MENNDKALHVNLTHKADKFVLSIPELCLIVEDTNLSAAYEKLEKRRRDLFEDVVRLGAVDQFFTTKNDDDATLVKKLMPFFIKSTVVALVGVLLLSAASISFTYALREPLRKAGLKAGRAAIKNFTKGLNEFGENGLSPSREKKLRLALRAAVPQLKPYMIELRPLYIELAYPPLGQ